MTHSLRYTRLSLLFDEMSLAAESDERRCIAGFWTQGVSSIYISKPVASRFGQMVKRIQDWWILICVYHLPKAGSFNEKRPRKPETNIQKRFEGMKSKFLPGIFQPEKTFRLFQELSTEMSKNWVNGKPGKAPKRPLSLF